VLSEIYERANSATIEFQSTAQFLRDWIQSKKMTTAPGTSRRYADTVEGFIKHLGAKSERSLGAATPSDVLTYRDQQLAQGKSNKTANMEVKTLRICFNMARKQGLILTNPAEAVELLPEMSVGREIFTRQQILDLLNVADQEWRGMILLGACHGLRLGLQHE
jgi:site-specific recombinase XerD